MKSMRCAVFGLAILAVLAVLILGGCASVRPISDSGYRDESGRGESNPLYKGELTEFQVLGIQPGAKTSEADINRALDAKKNLTLAKGSNIMLIQSGAMIPDEPMAKALEKYYNITTFSGIPESGASNDYSLALRLAAARGGFERIAAYWGFLETAQRDLATKAISWVPLIGNIIPDEGQEMRIRLKMAVVDVRTGQWDMFSPEPFQDEAKSASFSRKSSDQSQVALLKKKGYEAAAEELVKRYAR